jgi:PKD repeat protein
LGDTLQLSTDIYSTYSWNSGENTNQINVSTPGTYKVSIEDSIGCIGISSDFVVAEDSIPQAIFNYANSLRNFNFLSFTLNGSSYTWDFGDGTPSVTTSTRTTVNHIYATGGIFTVTLIVSNYCGTDTITRVVSSIGTGIETVEVENKLQV